jgi:hypothetical protein
MTDRFNRAYRLIIGTTEIDARAGANEGLRIAFEVNRDEKRTPNNVSIQVYNLPEPIFESLAAKPSVSVSLEAGYVDDVGVLFLGDLRSASTRREGPDLITTIAGGDGENAIKSARINRTFKRGTSVRDVLRGLGSALGVQAGNLNSVALTGALPHARTCCGLAADELEEFCRTQGLRWSVQDSALQIRTEGEPLAETQGPLLRADSGLIGEPEVERKRFTQKTWPQVRPPLLAGAPVTREILKVTASGTSLLRHDLIPGVAFRVESPRFSANLVATQTTHVGDSHGSDWFCNWSGRVYG